MKKLELPCYLVEDLLPLYADHLVSSQTKDNIQFHLSHCKNCSLKFQAMITPMETQEQAAQTINAGGVQFLRKERRMGIYKIIAAAVCCLILSVGLFYWIVFHQLAFDFQVQNLYRLTDGTIYFELVPSEEESAINSISYHDTISQERSCYEIHMGYSLLSLWQNQINSSSGRVYCFIRTPEPNADKTGYLPIYYTQGSCKLLIWDGEDNLPPAPDDVEQKALNILSPFYVRNDA